MLCFPYASQVINNEIYYFHNVCYLFYNIFLVDVWDGTNNEPVIYHGYTLTSKIYLKDVLQAIKEYAFCVSE